MKKILILSCLFLFFVSSCSNQEEVIVGDGLDYDNMSEEDLRKCAEANGAITWNQFIELMGEFMESEQSPLIETKATSETFSVTGYDNTFLVEENKKVLINKSPTNIPTGYDNTFLVEENKKVLINKSPTNIPTGYYFCDIYIVRKMVTLPDGTLGVTKESPKCGFDPNSIGGGLRGCAVDGQTGNRFYMKTAAYQVKYDMLGRQWNRWDPSLNALVWNYAYIY